MRPEKIIVIGASAGGVEIIGQIIAALPAELPAAILAVQHLSPDFESALPQIFGKDSRLPVQHPSDGIAMRASHIYVAPPDHHLLVEHNQLLVRRGPKENRFRPSIDALFRSAAYSHGANVIGVVLSGSLDDGTSGLWTVKRRGGISVIQDPADAAFESMPASALAQVEIDYRLPAAEIGPLLVRLVREAHTEPVKMEDEDKTRMEIEIGIATGANALGRGAMDLGSLSPFTCPECHGVLAQISEGDTIRFRCHTGHAYSQSALLSEIAEKVDASYWDAMRSLEEASMLLRRMGAELEQKGQAAGAQAAFERARHAIEQTQQLRAALMSKGNFGRGRKPGTAQGL